MAGHDQFNGLATELKHQIFSYVHTSHFPDKAKFENWGRYKAPRPDLLSLALVSKPMYAEVSSWAHGFMLKHTTITKYRERKTAKAAAKQNPLNKFIHWSKHKCAFCGKTTVRTAILMNGLKCCTDCDRKQWPDKISKTDAKKKYHLSEEMLIPPLTRYGGRSTKGFKRPTYGTYFCQGTLTTMFDEADVRRFAELAHGGSSNLEADMEKREKTRVERQRKQEEKMARPVMQLG